MLAFNFKRRSFFERWVSMIGWPAFFFMVFVPFGIVDAQTYSVSTVAAISNFPALRGLAVDSAGNVYVATGNAVEKVVLTGVTSVLAGSLTISGSADGLGGNALFNNPQGLSTDGAGNIYVADTGNNAIRKITPQGVVSTLAGLVKGNADGTGIAAQFNQPVGVAVDSTGNVYVADTGNNLLREITPTGTTTTLLSGSTLTFAANVFVSTSYSIVAVAVNSTGIPYIGVNFMVHTVPHEFPYLEVLKVTGANSYAEFFGQGGLNGAPTSFTLDNSGNVFIGYQGQIYLGYEGSIDGPSSALSIVGLGQGSYFGFLLANDSHGNIYSSTSTGIVELIPVGTTPTISAQPIGGTLTFGASVTLSVSATGTPPFSYQWQFNGTPITGATSSSYAASLPGTYSVAVTNSAGSITSTTAVLTAANRLANISSRAFVGTGGNLEIAGFVIAGPPGTTEPVLVRAIGPTLSSSFNVSGVLAQPVLTLDDSSNKVVATNTAWNTNTNSAQIATAFASVGAFNLPLGSADSALLVNLSPGAYTAQVSGVNSGTGVALVEVYELSSGSPELINISTRALVGTGSNVEIAGIAVRGSQPAKLLIRAVGPTLRQFGVSGVLAQPSLSVVDSKGNNVASNTGWSNNSNAAAITAAAAATGAFVLPSGSADSALLLTLPPGAYTAVVSGVNGTSGVALVEVYQAP